MSNRAAASPYASLNALYRAPESQVLAALVEQARLEPDDRPAVRDRAAGLIGAVREHRRGWIDQFLQEYGLSEGEGVALLGLAEAYLRVPDAVTATALIEDKISTGDWKGHLGGSPDLMVNSATLGFVTTKALMAAGPEAPLRRLVARIGEPAIRRGVAAAMQMMGGHFVVGRTIEEALRRAAPAVCSFDMLGESARTADDADRYFEAYRNAIEVAGRSGSRDAPIGQRHSISVKLSALHPRYEETNAKRSGAELSARLIELAQAAAAADIGLTVDAEETDRLVLSLDIIGAAAAAPSLRGWDGLGMAIQAYQKRCPAVIDWASETARASGRRLQVRLVKGAYWDTEIKRAQEQGLSDYPVFTRKSATDVSYLANARRMLAASNTIQPAFATHNALTVATLLHWIGDRRDVEFQRLHGMGEGLHARVTAETGIQCRLYAPVGGYRDLLAYLVRRLLENGANSSFVHQSSDPSFPLDALLADPVDEVAQAGFAPHPAIPLPVNLYGAERRNSEGLDLSNREILGDIQTKIDSMAPVMRVAQPLIGGKPAGVGQTAPVRSPNDGERLVGHSLEATAADVAHAITVASGAFPAWSGQPVEVRAQALEQMADLMEQQRDALMALCVHEAGKSIPDAVAEVREAVDFCRYYAVQARRLFTPQLLKGPTGERDELHSAGRGVFACISPWNFPLAIFVGQIAAALAAGNAVVAKAAPQTPLIADAAVRLFHEAGVPAGALNLLPGGAAVGSALVADARVAGVAFTGSTGAARRIARSLLDDEDRPLAPLIAETGGINAMIVDSTALPEQVVADVIASAFQSAGQRCSALRLLCLQEEIADKVLEMLKGAMDQLTIGASGALTTDVGPVIDAAAKAAIDAHIAAHQDRVIHRIGVGDAPTGGHFVTPVVIALDRVEDLKREVFGPVLHVVTWKAGDLEGLVSRINAGGYGLTMGLHSRLASSAETVKSLAHVGNLYVNRTMIGAVVGVQPFGGEGLSGTGPKAGGPNYLMRFAVERVVSTDTTSAGGNASLMNLESAGG